MDSTQEGRNYLIYNYNFMALLTTQDFTEILWRSFQEALKQKMDEEYEVAKQEMQEKLDREKEKFIAGWIINMSERVDVMQDARRVIFTIDKKTQ